MRKIIEEKVLGKGKGNIWFDTVLDFDENRNDRNKKPFVALGVKQKKKLYDFYNKRGRKRLLICGLVPTNK